MNTDGLPAGLLQGIGTVYADLRRADLLTHPALDAEGFVPENAGIVFLDGNTNG